MSDVGAKDFTELVAWQRADELRQLVHELTGSGAASRDFKFAAQIRDAADGTTRNIAEGFGRYGHKEFARFVNIALGCVDEVKDCMRSGLLRGVISTGHHEAAQVKVRRARSAMLGLLRYLRSTEAPDPYNHDPSDSP
jgi:four helix bundle protein